MDSRDKNSKCSLQSGEDWWDSVAEMLEGYSRREELRREDDLG